MGSKAETDTGEPAVAAESVSCVELLDRGVLCSMGVTAARASAEPVPPTMGMAETKKTVSPAGEIDTRPVQPLMVATEAGTQATNRPGGAEIPLILIRGSCERKSLNTVEVRGSPPKAACSVRGTSPPKTVLSPRRTSPSKAVRSVRRTGPPKPTPGIGEERARSPSARRR